MKEMLTRIILFLNFFLRILVYPLKRLSLLLFPSTEYDGINQSAEIGAKAFSFSFQKLFLPPSSSQQQQTQTDTDDTITNINPFVNMGYTKCVVESQKQNKIVLLYLHSPMHPQCNKFCSSILSHPRVVQKLSSPSFICWGSSIQYAEAANVARMFNVTSYPFVALIASGLTDRSSSSSSSSSASAALSKVELLWKMEGGSSSSSMISLDEFSRSMEMVHTAHQSIISEIETRRLRREEEIRLRNEQDREFQETLLADQKRIAEKEAAEQKKRLEQQQKDELKQLELAKKESLLHEARSLLAASSQEPNSDTGTGTGEKCARIRITLPSGVKIDRRFQPTDQIKHVRAFLTLYFDEHKIPIQNFSLSSSYPRRTYDDDELTLQEGGLCPMAVLMLVDLDA